MDRAHERRFVGGGPWRAQPGSALDAPARRLAGPRRYFFRFFGCAFAEVSRSTMRVFTQAPSRIS